MVIVAVSGGSDSIALLLLASAWSQVSGVDIQCVTVDHGLRPEAAAEAAFVAGVSEGLNIPHVTLAWDGLKPATGVANAARNARYRLLEEFAKDIDVSAILVGHTANDQAETLVMRNARGSTQASQIRGLSGMAAKARLPGGTRLHRPLLGHTREILRRYLIELNQSWVEDPSNHDPSYERVRVRNALGDDEREILSAARFAALNGRERLVSSDRVALLLSENMSIENGPVFSLPLAVLSSIEPPLRVLALQIMVCLAGGGRYLTNEQNIRQLLDDGGVSRTTMGNAVVEQDETQVRVHREKRNLPSIIVAPGEETIWDNRLHIINESATSYFCGPLDPARHQDAEDILGQPLTVSPRAAVSTTPFLCGDGDDLFLPFVGGFVAPANLKCSLVCPAIEHFCPEYDFALLGLVEAVRESIKRPSLHKR